MIATINPLAPAPRRGVPFSRFLVSRVVLAGRGRANSPCEESSEEHIFEDRPMSLREVVAELETCRELSCPRDTPVLQGSEYAMTSPRTVDGWNETEIVFIRRGDGRPVSARVLHRLFYAADLLSRRVGGGR